MGLHQTKKRLHNKTINRMKRQPIEGKEVSANFISDKGLVSRVHK